MVSASFETTPRLCSTMMMVRPAETRLIRSVTGADIFGTHALRRLVEQHQFGFEPQRRGNLQRALAAIGQLDGVADGRNRFRPTWSSRSIASSSRLCSTFFERQNW